MIDLQILVRMSPKRVSWAGYLTRKRHTATSIRVKNCKISGNCNATQTYCIFFHLVVGKTPPTKLNKSDVNVVIQDEAMDVAQFAPQGARYHADVFYMLP